MIGFHEVRFPEDVSWGSRGGPEFKTQVFTSHRGYEKRNIDWSQPMMSFDASYGIKTDAQIIEVLSFFNARQGRLYGFRYKNWSNYQILSGPITTGDGVSRRLAIYKFYGFPGNQFYKRLRKIVRGSVTGVSIGDTPLTEGVDFRIDYDSGEIALNTPAGYGVPVFAQTLEFDEPVHFEDDSMQNVIEQWNNNSLSSLDLMGIRGEYTTGTVFSPDLVEKGKVDPLYPQTSLLLNFDGTDTTTTKDYSRLNNTVTFNGTAGVTSSTYRDGSGAFIAGSSGYASIPSEPFLLPLIRSFFTLELYAQRPTTGETYQPMVAVWVEVTNDRAWMLRYNSGTKRIEYLASTNGTTERVILSYPWDTTPGFFDHISVDRLSGGWYILRINGKVKRVSQDVLGINSSTDTPLTIGGMSLYDAGEGPFQSAIDSVRITMGASRYDTFSDNDIPAPFGVN